MTALLLAAVLAVPAIQDTVTALPGTGLRFGAESARFGVAQGFQPSARPAQGGRSERVGTMRFFGIDADATLSFLERRLVQADFVIESASPRQISYIEDDLRRRGYRRACAVRDRERSQCTWTGAAHVEITREGARLSATLRPLTPEAPAAGPPPGPPAAAIPVHPDTLWTQEDAGRQFVESMVAPSFPEAAREASVMGVVRMAALVDTNGAVAEIRMMHGIPELDDAARAALRQWRFRPSTYDGRAAMRWVVVPMRFTLH